MEWIKKWNKRKLRSEKKLFLKEGKIFEGKNSVKWSEKFIFKGGGKILIEKCKKIEENF